MTTETTKFPDMTEMGDDAVLYRVYCDTAWSGNPVAAFAREYARQMVAADREKRGGELTEGVISREWDLSEVPRKATPRYVVLPWERQEEIRTFAHRIFALARPSDASAVDLTTVKREGWDEAIAWGHSESLAWGIDRWNAERNRRYPLPSPRCVLSTGEVWERDAMPEHEPYWRTFANGAAAGASAANLHSRIGELSVAGLTEDVAKLVAFAKEGK